MKFYRCKLLYRVLVPQVNSNMLSTYAPNDHLKISANSFTILPLKLLPKWKFKTKYIHMILEGS